MLNAHNYLPKSTNQIQLALIAQLIIMTVPVVRADSARTCLLPQWAAVCCDGRRTRRRQGPPLPPPIFIGSATMLQ